MLRDGYDFYWYRRSRASRISLKDERGFLR
jgi:hypothetical protein